MVACYRKLKRKVSRLRDWNIRATHQRRRQKLKLKRKVSRLRDWNIRATHQRRRQKLKLKRKVSRLRDWNFWCRTDSRTLSSSLKRKVSRLRDWNLDVAFGIFDDKFRVEKKSFSIARLKLIQSRPHDTRGCVEKKSFSIARLKHELKLLQETLTRYSWKEKFLDCEIETGWSSAVSQTLQYQVEKKSFSIARLKQVSQRVNTNYCQSWKEKFLDCEIETDDYRRCYHRALR